MRDDRSGIEVRVLLPQQSTTCREWTAPLSSRYNSTRGRRAFIEGKAGEPFEIHTTVNNDFDWAAMKHLLISYRVDGRTVRTVAISKDDALSLHGTMSSVHDVCKSCRLLVDGALQRYGLVFHTSELVDEPQFLSIDEEEYELSRRGKLEVRVKRVTLSKQRKPATKRVPQQAHEPLLMRPQSNKKVIMDNGRSHFTRFVPQGIASSHRRSGASSDRAWIPARGRAGKRMKFEIYYTSQMFLSRERMIPTNNTARTKQHARPTAASVEVNRSGRALARSGTAHSAQHLVGLDRHNSNRERYAVDVPVIDLTEPEVDRAESPSRAIDRGGQTGHSIPRQCRIADIID